MNRLALTRNTTLLDVAGGTGDIAFRAVRKIQKGFVVLFHFLIVLNILFIIYLSFIL